MLLELGDWPCLRQRAVQEEIVAWVRRRSSAFSRGRSRFRGVSGQQGRWEARIGTFAGRKNARPALQLAGPRKRLRVLAACLS